MTRISMACKRTFMTNRVVDVRYFSHTWHDGDWHGNVMVVIPEVILHEGVVTMADTGADIIEPGMDMNMEFLDCMANQFGIAAATATPRPLATKPRPPGARTR